MRLGGSKKNHPQKEFYNLQQPIAHSDAGGSKLKSTTDTKQNMHLILYSKPGCHLCEALQEKLQQIPGINLELEIRDITTREDWFAAYQYQIPVLCRLVANSTGSEIVEQPLPRSSPRSSVQQLQQMLQKYFPKNDSQ